MAASIFSPSSRAGTMIDSAGHSAGGARHEASFFKFQQMSTGHSGINKNAQKANNSQPLVMGSQDGMAVPQFRVMERIQEIVEQ